MKITGKTDIGNTRMENQDTYCASHLLNDRDFAVVCDGMGGAFGGAIASALACKTIEQRLNEVLCGAGDEEAVHSAVLEAIELANRAVYDKSVGSVAARGMGTTVAAVAVAGEMAHIAHVGDSRVYRLRRGKLQQLTTDHSMVQELVENGSITPEEARNHPRKNLITRALGIEPSVEASYRVEPVVAGDVFLLCSDGLTSGVRDEEITDILCTTPFFNTAEALVRAALHAHVQDNITAVLMQAEPLEG